jgi:hypothetical protein
MRTTNKRVLGVLAAAAMAATLGLGGRASAADLISVNTTDFFALVFGPFSGVIDSAATGAGAELSWYSAGYNWTGNIELTDAAGVAAFDIQTNGDDLYTLFAPASGNANIGTTCVVGPTRGCVVITPGTPTSLLGAVTALNGGLGICCGVSADLVVTSFAGGVPEPAAWALMLVGFGGIGAMIRRRRTQPVPASA